MNEVCSHCCHLPLPVFSDKICFHGLDSQDQNGASSKYDSRNSNGGRQQGTISPADNNVPPFFVFPHVPIKNLLLKQAPIGSSGTSSRSVWMQEDSLLIYT
ncbi:hypothetical protein RRG08_044899 [Elysia crispata]|uniref:Uncharacterized protein n=1 Tax=Elysia crispata TaxID=231223 RepID=A0AAE0XEB8_9GAST|nr:hypothetical protein RRG08_044899 [Elysia crispata]